MPRTPRNPRKPGIRRYIFNTLTVVSLLLMLATVGLWAVSYWDGLAIWFEHPGWVLGQWSHNGRVDTWVQTDRNSIL